MGLGAAPINSAPSRQASARTHINFSTPAGWALFYWFIAASIIAFMFLTV